MRTLTLLLTVLVGCSANDEDMDQTRHRQHREQCVCGWRLIVVAVGNESSTVTSVTDNTGNTYVSANASCTHVATNCADGVSGEICTRRTRVPV